MREACARRPFERLHDVSGNAEVGTPFRISITIYLRACYQTASKTGR